MFNSDEEIGSVDSGELFASLGAEQDYVPSCEPSPKHLSLCLLFLQGLDRKLTLVDNTGGPTNAEFASRSGKAIVLESFGLGAPSLTTWANSAANSCRCKTRKSHTVRYLGKLPALSTRNATSSCSFLAILREENTQVAYVYNNTLAIVAGQNG